MKYSAHFSDFPNVTLMITACAGRFTPQARVAVHTSTLMWPLENMLSIRLRSDLNMPAWWIPKPSGNISFICLFLERWIWNEGAKQRWVGGIRVNVHTCTYTGMTLRGLPGIHPHQISPSSTQRSDLLGSALLTGASCIRCLGSTDCRGVDTNSGGKQFFFRQLAMVTLHHWVSRLLKAQRAMTNRPHQPTHTSSTSSRHVRVWCTRLCCSIFFPQAEKIVKPCCNYSLLTNNLMTTSAVSLQPTRNQCGK